MEASGKQAADFFAQIKNEALGLIAALVGAKGIEDFLSGTTTSLASLGREAKNIGVSTTALSAFSNVIQRNGGSAESARQSLFGLAQQIENFKVYGDPHILRFLNPIGADINDSPLAVFMKFMKFAQEHANDPKLINLIGHGLGFDQGTINAAEQLKTVAEYQEEYNDALRDAPTPQAIAEAQELQKRWAALRQAGASLGNMIFSNLAPALTTAAKGMRDWLEANKGWLADDITGKVHSLGDDISYASKQMQGFWSGAETVAAYFAGPFAIAVMAGLGPIQVALATIIAGLALIDEAKKKVDWSTLPASSPLWAGTDAKWQSNYVNSPRSQAFLHPGNPNQFEWYNPGSWMGHKPTPLESAQRQSNIDAIRKFFLAQGYTPDQVAGILANASAESGFDPTASNGSHYGLFQWDAARSTQFAAIFGHPIQQSTLQEQLQFAQWELTHTESAAGTALRRARGPYESGEVFSLDYERAPGGVLTGEYRGNLAQQYLTAPGASGTAAQYAPPPAARHAPPQHPAGTSASPASPQHTAAAGSPAGSHTEININGPINIVTKSTDAKGIAKDLTQAIVTQANRGLQ